MKRAVRVIETTKAGVEIEVEFPIYRKNDIPLDNGTSVIYSRWDGETVWSVQRSQPYRGGSIEWEISKETQAATPEIREPDYELGRGEYASTREEFETAVAAARAFLAELDGQR